MQFTKRHRIAAGVVFLTLFFFIGQAHRFSLHAAKSCQPVGYEAPGIVSAVEGWLGYMPTVISAHCENPGVDGIKALQIVVVLTAFILMAYAVVATIIRTVLIMRGVIKGNIIK